MSKLFKKYTSKTNSSESKEFYLLVENCQAMFMNGMDENDIRNILSDSIESENSYYSGKVSKRMVDNIIAVSKKKEYSDEKTISFSNQELVFIHSLDNLKLEKILFLLICLYKYYGDGFSFKDTVLAREAEVNRKKLEISSFINSRKDKYFYVDKRDKVLKIFACDCIKDLESGNDLVISDFRNCIYYYLQYFKIDEFFVCSKCGIIEKKIITGRPNKYCSVCSKESKNEKNKKYDYYKARK